MTYILAPGAAQHDSAELWVGAVGEDQTLAHARLELNGQTLPLGPWQTLAKSDGAVLLHHQRIRIPRPSGTGTVPVRLVTSRAPQPGEAAVLRFLPARLPTDGTAFSVLLGSCFAKPKDHGGAAGRTYLSIPDARRPDLKIFCGDQVYLDSRYSELPLPGSDVDGHLEAFNAIYLNSWRGPTSLQDLLVDGPNWFIADDHELWNNYPLPSHLFGPWTWSKRGRASWEEAARRLYRTYQTPEVCAEFEVPGAPGLSFFLADMRLGRTKDRQRFMADADLQGLGDWIDGLTGPGVLVAGSPLFYEPTGWVGALNNLELSNFGQYPRLAAHLQRSKHSLLFLTGDVHWGRIASCTLPSGKELIEIISSPLALTSKASQKGKPWKEAPPTFPVNAAKGVTVTTLPKGTPYKILDDHFVTLEFRQVAGGIALDVCPWLIGKTGSSNGAPAFSTVLS